MSQFSVATNATINGNTGSATLPVTLQTQNTNVKFVATGNTVTLNFAPSDGFGGNLHVGAIPVGPNPQAHSNVSFGIGSLSNLIKGDSNTAVGDQALGSLSGTSITGAYDNTAVGAESLELLTTGTESDNICIGSSGQFGDSGIIRIGDLFTHFQTYLAGVVNTGSGRVVKTATKNSSPYTTQDTDYALFLNTTSAIFNLSLLASPVTGATYRIKDYTGNAATNNIVISPIGKTINGSASVVINTNYGSLDVIYNGSEWSTL